MLTPSYSLVELDVGFEADAAALLEDVLSPAGLDSAGFDSVFDSVFGSLDDSEAGFSELELEEDFDA
jgi:hypothetical protein